MFGRAKGMLLVGVLLVPTLAALAGEKIQFSKPSGGEAANTAPARESATKNSPNLFDNFKKGGVDSFNFTPAAPQAPAPDRGNKKEDWIFARPGDGPTIEEVLDIKDESAKKESTDRFQNSISKYVEAAEAAAAAKQNADLQSNQFESPFSELTSDRNALDQQGPASAFSNRDTLFDNQRDSVADYLKELRSPERERIDDMNLARRNEFQQIFQSRNALPSASGLDKPLNPLDATRQPTGTPAVTAPSDLLSRTTQSSFSDPSKGNYEPLTATRSSGFEDVNSRVLGREASSPLNTTVEPLRAAPQPAVLPFPSRPGSLLQRP